MSVKLPFPGALSGWNVADQQDDDSGTLFSYYNVIQARRKANKPVLEPLLGLLPYFFHTSLLVAWLAGPRVDIVPTEKILWFTVYWAAT